MLNPKRLICSYNLGLAKPLPTSSYALVSRDILCYCHLQIGLTYILKSIASCNITTTPTLEYTVNLAFMDYFQSFWRNGTLYHIPLVPSMEEIVLPVAMEDYTKDPQFLSYGKDIKKESKHISRTVTDNSPEASIPQIKKITFRIMPCTRQSPLKLLQLKSLCQQSKQRP